MAGPCDNVKLLLAGEIDEFYRVTRNTDREVCVLFLLGVLHSVYELLLTEYVNVQMVRALIEITVEHEYEIRYLLRLRMSECVRIYRLCIRYTVERILIRKLCNRVE